MRSRYITIGVCFLLGILAGFIVLRWHSDDSSLVNRKPEPGATTSSTRLKKKDQPLSAWALMMQSCELSSEEWPAFYRKHHRTFAGKGILEELWAESDPEGYWKWQCEDENFDSLRGNGLNFLLTWADRDPDAAIHAATQITERELSDRFRASVLEHILGMDLEKGLHYVAEAQDFNRFSWGERQWIKNDPQKVAEGLSKLPKNNKFRDYLDYAVKDWAAIDPKGLLTWLSAQRYVFGEDWYYEGFLAVAETDPASVRSVIEKLDDPASRSAALCGFVGSGNLSVDEVLETLSAMTARDRYEAFDECIEGYDLRDSHERDQAKELVRKAPMSKHLLSGLKSFAAELYMRDSQDAIDFAAQHPDSAVRREFAKTFTNYIRDDNRALLLDYAAKAPMLDLSDDFFKGLLSPLTEDQRMELIRQLPADKAAWAESLFQK